MTDAGTTPTSGPVDVPRDPDVDGLVPRSRRRTALTAGALVVALLVAGWASAAARPTVVDPSGASGGAARQLDATRMLVGVDLVPGGAGPLTVESVGDVPGARVLAAWVAPAAGRPGAGSATDRLFGQDGPTPEPGEPLDGGVPLPAAVPAGSGSWLVVLWDVTDCAAVVRGGPDGPEVRLRTLVGPVTEHLPLIAAPMYVEGCDADA